MDTGYLGMPVSRAKVMVIAVAGVHDIVAAAPGKVATLEIWPRSSRLGLAGGKIVSWGGKIMAPPRILAN